MPFKSEKQRRWMYANKPEMAKEWSSKYNDGGMIGGSNMHMKKVTQKDRYGNTMSYEFEVPEKPLDPTAIINKQMELSMPQLQSDDGIAMISMGEPPVMGEEFNMGDPNNHPGVPKGDDTVPAWLTPGEFVVNAEATEMYGPQIEAMNNHGRQVQQMKRGGDVERGSAAQIMAGMDPAAIVRMMGQLGNAYQFVAPAVGLQEGGGIPMPVSATEALLHAREGFRDDVYLDSLGKPTVGYGHLLGDEYMDQVGTKPFAQSELDSMFQQDMAAAQAAARKNVGEETYNNLNRRQKAALDSMAFQLGPTGQSKFKNMLQAIKEGDHDRAATEALTGAKPGTKSKWLRQTPKRAMDLAEAFSPSVAAQYRKAGGVVYAEEGGLTSFLNKYILGDKAQIDTADVDDMGGVEATGDGWSPNITNPDLQQAEAWERMYAGQDPDDLGNWDETQTPPPARERSLSNLIGGDETIDWILGQGDYEDQNAAAQREVANMEDLMGGDGDDLIDTIPAEEEVDEVLAAAMEDNPEAAFGAGEEGVPDLPADVPMPDQTGTTEADAGAGEHTGPEVGRRGMTPYEIKMQKEAGKKLSEHLKKEQEKADAEAGAPNPAEGKTDEELQAAAVEQMKKDGDYTGLVRNYLEESPLGKEIGGALGSMFNAGELAKMAVYVAGSMAFGATPMQAMNFGVQKYLGGLEASQAAAASAAGLKQKQAFEAAKTGKFTPESIAAFQRDGNPARLVSKTGDDPALELAKTGKFTPESINAYMRSGDVNDLVQNSNVWTGKEREKQIVQLKKDGYTQDSIDSYIRSINEGKSNPNLLVKTPETTKVPTRTDQKVFVQGSGIRDVWQDPATGTQYIRSNKDGSLTPLANIVHSTYDKATMGSPAIQQRASTLVSELEGVSNQGLEKGEEGFVNIPNTRLASQYDRLFQSEIRNAKYPVGSTALVQSQLDIATEMWMNDHVAAAREGRRGPTVDALEHYYNSLKISQNNGLSPQQIIGTSPDNAHKISNLIKADPDFKGQDVTQVYGTANAAWARVPEGEKEKWAKQAEKVGNYSPFMYFMRELLDDKSSATKYLPQ